MQYILIFLLWQSRFMNISSVLLILMLMNCNIILRSSLMLIVYLCMTFTLGRPMMLQGLKFLR